MSADLQPTTDRNGVSWTDYVRAVEFLDADPPGRDRPPVHVVRRVLFDGAICPARIRRSDGATLDLSNDGGTVLTLHVHVDDVQVGRTDDDGTYVPHLIGDRHVLTPAEPGWAWQPADPDDPTNPWMVVAIQVAEVYAR